MKTIIALEIALFLAICTGMYYFRFLKPPKPQTFLIHAIDRNPEIRLVDRTVI